MRHNAHSLLLILAILLSPSAHAALGGNVEAVTTNANSGIVARKQQRNTIPSNGYSIHESTSEAGTSVREYAQQGVVFAVAWSGPSLPNLQQLLGNYFPQFKNAMKQRRDQGIRGPVMLKQDDLVVESRGHMRDFRGRAYVPGLLPPHISIEEIQ